MTFRIRLFCTLAFALGLLLSISAAAAAKASKGTGGCRNAAGELGGALFRIGDSYEYQGLTPHGKQQVLQARQQLLDAETLGRVNMMEADSFLNVLMMAQTGRWNIAALGDGGGNKTGFFDFMVPDLWVKQVHELMNEVPLIGGQTEQGMREGREDINTNGTIIGARVAMIDEGQNANPPVLMTLQSVANERWITVNGQKIRADNLRTLIYTGNAPKHAIIQQFINRDMAFSGPPFLNRFHFKFRVHNWLRSESQAKLDALVAKRDYLRAIAPDHPEALHDLALQKPKEIDFDTLERFAFTVFDTTPELDAVLRDFADEMKKETEKEILESEKNHRADPKTYPHVLTPSADYTTRLRSQLARMVKVSAALDFLRSGMATEGNIDKLTKQRIKLGPLSAWRTWSVLTTVEKDRVVFDPFSQEVHFGVHFDARDRMISRNVTQEIEQAKSIQLQNEIKESADEQERFKAMLKNAWKILHNSNQEAAQVGGKKGNGDEMFDEENVDFELRLARAGGTDVKKLKK